MLFFLSNLYFPLKHNNFPWPLPSLFKVTFCITFEENFTNAFVDVCFIPTSIMYRASEIISEKNTVVIFQHLYIKRLGFFCLKLHDSHYISPDSIDWPFEKVIKSFVLQPQTEVIFGTRIAEPTLIS